MSVTNTGGRYRFVSDLFMVNLSVTVCQEKHEKNVGETGPERPVDKRQNATTLETKGEKTSCCVQRKYQR